MPKEVSKRGQLPVKKNKGQQGAQWFFSKLTRDVILFTTGLAGVFHETVLTNAERPTLLFVFGAMIGLPAFLRTDEARKKSDED